MKFFDNREKHFCESFIIFFLEILYDKKSVINDWLTMCLGEQ